jgi:hypothetical protein
MGWGCGIVFVFVFLKGEFGIGKECIAGVFGLIKNKALLFCLSR